MLTETESKNKFTRHVAIKTVIKNLLSGEYIQENEQNSNYLLTKDNQKIFRLNTIAIIIKKETPGSVTNLLVEDGTGKIILRLFEENKKIDSLTVGNIVLIIGRIRMYNQEIYISPEIIRKTNNLWLKARSLELNLKKTPEIKKVITENENEFKNKTKNVEKSFEKEDYVLPLQKLKNLISELDLGEGVLIEEVIEKSPLEKTEELVEKMLETGDIFQNIPGRIKVL